MPLGGMYSPVFCGVIGRALTEYANGSSVMLLCAERKFTLELTGLFHSSVVPRSGMGV